MAALGVAFATAAQASLTAKAAMQEVAAAGQKWQRDAVVTHLSTLVARPDGKAARWLYTLYSPSAKKSAIVTASPGKIEVLPVDRNTQTEPLGTDFIDSDKAMEVARKAGLPLKGDAAMGLTKGGQATGKPTLFWSVTVMTSDGVSAVTIHGKDGTLVKRDDTKLK